MLKSVALVTLAINLLNASVEEKLRKSCADMISDPMCMTDYSLFWINSIQAEALCLSYVVRATS